MMDLTPQREALTAVDAAWLRMDRPTNLMMICGMIMLDSPLELQALRALVQARMLCFHRFRQRIVDAAGNPYWELDPDFNLDWHVRRCALPAGSAALEDLVSDLLSTALDPHKPMWQFHLIDMPGASVLVMRIHHCYGDGFAMLHLFDAITDADPARPGEPEDDLAPSGPQRSAWERVLGPASEVTGDTLRVLRAAAGAGVSLLTDRSHALDAARAGADLLVQAAIIANMAPDAPSRLKGELGVMKKVAWAPPLPLAEVKAVAGVLGCTVNDVLIGCVAGALRAWLADKGDAVDKLELRALVPVNLRPAGRLTELGNHFGMVFLDLPIGIDEPVERALEAHRRMALLKQSKQPLVAFGILAAMGVSPGFLRERILEALAANASLVVTNVRGPDAPRYLAGQRIGRQMFWVPQSGGIGLGISLLSYAGEVSFGVAADARRIPDPAAIPQLFARQFEALLLCALMLPWPGQPGAIAPVRPARPPQ
jgi:WS/DGAT/MGAT family acyltransferase